ncbi:MAG: MFS transporter [Pseudomonadota bacterium]
MTTHPAPNSPASRFSLGRLFLFGLPALPGAALLFPLSAYLPPYYSAVTGLGLGTIGLIFMVMRFWDIAIDPVIGIMSDRTRSRFGRRRPWIAASVPVLGIGVWALFFPPQGVGAVWLAASLMVAFIGFTLLTITHYAWAADLSEDPHERSKLQGAIVIVGLVGTLVAMLLPAIFEVGAADPMKARVESMGLAALILLLPCVGLALWLTPDPTAVRSPTSQQTDLSSVRRALANGPFRWILAADFVQGIAGGLLLSTFIFFSARFLELPDRAGLLLLLFFVSGVAFVPLWLIVAKRLGKVRTTALASLATLPAIALYILIPKGDLAWAALVQIAFGSTLGVWIFLTRSIVADLVDTDGGDTRPTGVYFALTTLTTKLGQAMAVGIGYVALDKLGVDPAMGTGNPSIIAAFTLIPPTLGHLFMILAMWRIGKGQSEIQELSRLD